MNKLGELMQKIPGYGGYIQREKIRDEDRKLREAIADAFSSQVTRITRVQEQMLKRGDLENLDALDGVIGRLQHLSDRIRTATYGFEGFSLYDESPIDETVLNALYDFDFALTKGVEEVADLLAQLGANDNPEYYVSLLNDKLDALHAAFDGRAAVIENPLSAASLPPADTSLTPDSDTDPNAPETPVL